MKKRTLILAMTALMITMTSAGNCTAVYAEETAAATEDAGSTEFPIKPLSAKVVDENPYMADSDSNIHHDCYNTDSTDEEACQPFGLRAPVFFACAPKCGQLARRGTL